MNQPNNLLINSLFDMATAQKAIGEFAGSGSEDAFEWIEGVELVGELTGASKEMLLKMAMMALRGEAKQWGRKIYKEKGIREWDGFKVEFTCNFSNQTTADEALRRFFQTMEVQSYDALIKLFKDARLIKRSRGVNGENLLRQLIPRVPAALKGYLIDASHKNVELERALAVVEGLAWTVFPERAVNEIEVEECREGIERVDKEEVKTKEGNRWFCRFHGKGNHSTKFCEVVRKMEKLGWVRERRENRNYETKLNKSGSYYRVNKCTYKRKNPFFTMGVINKKEVPILIDIEQMYNSK